MRVHPGPPVGRPTGDHGPAPDIGWAVAPDHRTPATAPHRSIVGLVRACHFQPTLAVTAVTTGLAALAGRSAWGCVAVAAAVLAGQLSTGWSNDWFDAPRDRAAGRTDKPIVAGDVSVGTVRAAACTALVAAVPLSLLSGWRAAGAHLVAIASAWAYNLGLKATVVSPVPYALSFGLLPAFVAQPDVAHGALTEVLQRERVKPASLAMLFQRVRRTVPKVAAFRDEALSVLARDHLLAPRGSRL